MEYSFYRISTATLLAIVGVLVLGALLAVLLRRKTSMSAPRSFWTAAAVASVAAVLLITLNPSGRGGIQGCSFTLYGSVFDWIRGNQSTANVAMLVPAAIALTLATRSTRWFPWSLVALVVLPVLIEAAQAWLPVGRACDVTDVVDNWWGVAIGGLIGWIGSALQAAVAGRRPALA